MNIEDNTQYKNTGNGKAQIINSLQGLRAVAFLAVFISHAGLGSFSALGAWGVSVFIIMSGFLLVYRYQDRDISEKPFTFSIKKISKLYVLYVLMLLSAIMLSAYSIFRKSDYGKIIPLCFSAAADLALVQSWIPKSEFYFSLNSVSWYLSVAAFLYFIFPWIMKDISRIKNSFSACIRILFAFLAQIMIAVFSTVFGNENASEWFSQHWMTYICPFARLFDFYIGCVIGYLYVHRKQNNRFSWLCTIVELGALALTCLECILYANRTTVFGSESVKYTLLFTPVNALLVFLIAVRRGATSRLLSSRVFVNLGNVSSYAFLIHLMVIRYLSGAISFVGICLNAVVQAAIALIITITASMLYRLLYSIWNNKRTI